MPDEAVGVQDVPLPAYPEAKEQPVDRVEGDPDPCLLPPDPYHGLVYQDGMNARSPSSRGTCSPERRTSGPTDWRIASWLLFWTGSRILDAFLNDSAE